MAVILPVATMGYRKIEAINRSNLMDCPAARFRIAIHTTLDFRYQIAPGRTTGTDAAQREVMLKRRVIQFWLDQQGATAIEYGLIAAGIALAIIAIVNTLGGTVNTDFTSINSSLK